VGNSPVEATRCERALLTRSRAETGPPQKSFGLSGTKGTRVDGQRHGCDVGRRAVVRVSLARVNLVPRAASILGA